jgi:hypothetical protein
VRSPLVPCTTRQVCVPSPLAAFWQGGQVMQAGTFAAMPEEVRSAWSPAGRLGSVCYLPESITVPVHEPHEGLSYGG